MDKKIGFKVFIEGLETGFKERYFIHLSECTDFIRPIMDNELVYFYKIVHDRTGEIISEYRYSY